MKDCKNIAIIPARGGSKRIPHKNIKEFAGKPMIAWPIEAARKSGLFDKIIVSTDDAQIARVAEQYGAEAPFYRPAELADDYSPTANVLLHALKWLREHHLDSEYFACIYPTAPFLQASDLQEAYEILRRNNAPGILSVATFPYPILRALKKRGNGSLEFAWPEYKLTRSQDLPTFYQDAGQFYIYQTDSFIRHECQIVPGMLPYEMPRHRVQDIDDMEDFEMAERLFRLNMKQERSAWGDLA